MRRYIRHHKHTQAHKHAIKRAIYIHTSPQYAQPHNTPYKATPATNIPTPAQMTRMTNIARTVTAVLTHKPQRMLYAPTAPPSSPYPQHTTYQPPHDLHTTSTYTSTSRIKCVLFYDDHIVAKLQCERTITITYSNGRIISTVITLQKSKRTLTVRPYIPDGISLTYLREHNVECYTHIT